MILVATAKMRRVELPVTLRRTHSHSISLGTIFYGKTKKKKLWIISIEWVE